MKIKLCSRAPRVGSHAPRRHLFWGFIFDIRHVYGYRKKWVPRLGPGKSCKLGGDITYSQKSKTPNLNFKWNVNHLIREYIYSYSYLKGHFLYRIVWRISRNKPKSKKCSLSSFSLIIHKMAIILMIVIAY